MFTFLKPKHLIAILVAALAAPAFSQPVLLEQNKQDHRFYERKAEGWFWYEEPPIEEDEPEELPPVVVAPPPSEEAVPETAAQLATPPSVFSAQWFKDNLTKYKDAAWDDPTIENVRTYMYLQRYAMDRSEQFANVVELAVIGDPFLDEESRRPSATFASQPLDRWAGQHKDELSQKIAKSVGMFFFFSSDDDASRIQAPIVKLMENVGGFTVMPISVDGKAIPDGPYQDFKIDDGQAEALGVKVLPAIYLVSADREIEPVSQGVLSYADLNHRIIVASLRRGWITDEEFNKTRPILNLDNNIALIMEDFHDEIANLAAESTEPAESESNFVPPDQLGDLIRKKLREAR